MDTCFSVTANSVTLNCNGHIVSRGGDKEGYGFYNHGFAHVNVQNCEFNGFEYGILYTSPGDLPTQLPAGGSPT